MPCAIPLTRGYVATVDDEDAHLARYSWRASVNRSGVVYAKRSLPTAEGGGCSYLHREITGAAKGVVVDHRDGDGLNNRRENLHCCSQVINMMNVSGAKRRSSTGELGVCYVARINRWQARIRRGSGRRDNLGFFKTKDEAVRARLTAEIEYVGIQPRRIETFREHGFI